MFFTECILSPEDWCSERRPRATGECLNVLKMVTSKIQYLRKKEFQGPFRGMKVRLFNDYKYVDYLYVCRTSKVRP